MQELNNKPYHAQAQFTYPQNVKTVSTFNMVESLVKKELPNDSSNESPDQSDQVSIGFDAQMDKNRLPCDPTMFIADL